MTPGQLLRAQKKAILRLSIAVIILTTTTIIGFTAFVFERGEKYELRREVDTVVQAAVDQGLEFSRLTKLPRKARKPSNQ